MNKSTGRAFHLRCPSLALTAVVLLSGAAAVAGHAADGDGLLTRKNEKIFPIGFYELPESDAELKRMAAAGVNLVRCGSRTDLDRLQAAGIQGVVSLSLQQGDTDALRKHIESVKDHPALAVWEGPDEIVWTFTAYSGLYRTQGIYKSPDEWSRQTPLAIEYSESRAAEILPKLRQGIGLLRRLDPHQRQVWINEAHESDVRFVRQYIDDVDITGCDLYPVKHTERPIFKIGPATERWMHVGRGKPVWMVLQAFSWHELGEYYGHRTAAYPSFAESRFMAYEAIVHGAKGILYWGSRSTTPDVFRQSIYALTSELSSLQPFLVAPNNDRIRVTLIEPEKLPSDRGVKLSVRKVGRDWLLVLVNEDDRRHMGVEVSGLDQLDGRTLELLYGSESATVGHGELIVRMQPFEVKVFATGRKWESTQRAGRDYGLETLTQ